MSSKTWEKLKLKVSLRRPDVSLKSYEVMRVIKEADLYVIYRQIKHQLWLFMVDRSGPSLMGKDWLGKIRLDRKSWYRDGEKGWCFISRFIVAEVH